MSRIEAAVENSRIVGIAGMVRRWGRHSRIGQLLRDERTLLLFVGAVLLVSVVSVFQSNMAAAIKFLSFVLLFVLTAGVTLWFVGPLTE